jgi:HSP20 family molecular chaperone IbpA
MSQFDLFNKFFNCSSSLFSESNLPSNNFFQEDFINDFFKHQNTLDRTLRHKVKDGVHTYQIDMPGFSKDDVSVEVEDMLLHIKAENKKDSDFERQSISTSFKFPSNIDISSLEVKMENGELIVKVKEKEEKQISKRKVEIK